jgi:hypothetical protein
MERLRAGVADSAIILSFKFFGFKQCRPVAAKLF